MATPYDSYDEARQRMADETSRFIAWGLRNPDKVRWIPTQRADGDSTFSERLRFVFYAPMLGESLSRPVNWIRRLIGR